MRRRTKLVLGCIAIVATFATGIRVGVHLGVQEFLAMESAVKASLLATELRAIRQGSTDRLIPLKEIELDGYVVSALGHQEAGLPWLFWPLDLPYEHQRHLDAVARYRKDYPRLAEPLPHDCRAALHIEGCEDTQSEMAEYYREVQRRTEELTSKYGK